ncbi:MAG: SIR2 family protein [Gammaproteobacteria bacterium]|nr:SIR2 family protein [Gammaproteobacteria bacterium]
MTHTHDIASLSRALATGRLVPYLGPGVLELAGPSPGVPHSLATLAAALTAKASVPHKIRNNPTATAQFIENFKHRKTLSKIMTDAFTGAAPVTKLHSLIASLEKLPLVVTAWYDDALQRALEGRDGWGMVQGVSQAEHRDAWTKYYDPEGDEVTIDEAANWATLVYQPLGSVAPAANYIISDSDYVEVLTEIDIQTPIPELVKERRRDRGFLFLGERFATQLQRTFARQIVKRSVGPHFAVLPGELTKNELKFLAGQNIVRLDMPLETFAARLAPEPATAVLAAVG